MIWFAAAGAAISAASAVSNHMAQGKAAKQSNAYNRALAEQQNRDRESTMRWQNEVWSQDLQFAREQVAWQADEFQRQTAWVAKGQDAITRNRDASAFTLMLRAVEEDISFAFGREDTKRQGRAMRGTFAARDRGVEGNSVDAVLEDVFRQEGDAITVQDMNRSALNRQLYRESLAIDAEADQQLSSLASQVRTFSPSAPIRSPQPVASVAPARETEGPSLTSLGVNLGNAAVGGFNTYNTLSGQTARETVTQLSNWTRRQFSFE